jgi:hypothetical protein
MALNNLEFRDTRRIFISSRMNISRGKTTDTLSVIIKDHTRET